MNFETCDSIERKYTQSDVQRKLLLGNVGEKDTSEGEKIKTENCL